MDHNSGSGSRTPMLNPRLQRCLEPGVSIIVGSVDAQGVPVCCRGYAVRSSDDLETATVYLPVATSHETIQAVATTGRLAIGATYPADHSATQLKGVATDTRLAREDELAFVRERFSVYADVLEAFGIPKRLLNRATY